jgi:hypothetical protein
VLNEIVYPKEDSYGSSLYCTLQSFEATVVGGELCLRVQQWLVVSEKVTRKAKTCSSAPVVPDVHMCAHRHSSLRAWLWPVTVSQRTGLDRNNETVYYCPTCDTEWTFETKIIGKSEDDRVALFISKCYNLGNGTDPNSQRWKRHIELPPSGRVFSLPSTEVGMLHDFRKASSLGLTYRTMENQKSLTWLDKQLVPQPGRQGNPWIQTWIYQIDTREGKERRSLCGGEQSL